MKSQVQQKPTEAELEILQILWKIGAATVRSVNDRLNENKKVGYTTTLKIMQIMFDKGLLSRDEEKRSHVYRAEVREQEIQGLLLDKFLHSAFGGSALKLVMQALGNHRASKDEISEIRKLLDELEGGKK